MPFCFLSPSISLILIQFTIVVSQSGSHFTLVQGGQDTIVRGPGSILRAHQLRTADDVQSTTRRIHRDIPGVIFAPLDGSRVLTKSTFINANSKETTDEAYKIYDHFIATRGQSVLAQVSDPFFVTQPPERTTVATPTSRRFTKDYTPLPSFTMAATNRGRTSRHRSIIGARALRREEPRFPADTRQIKQERSTSLPENISPSFPTSTPQLAHPTQQQQPVFIGQFVDPTVQSPFRAAFIEQGRFIPDTRTADDIAWANYLAERNVEQFKMRRFRPGGSFTSNRRPGKPIPLPAGIELMNDDFVPVVNPQFELEQGGRRIPFSPLIENPPDSFDRPSSRLKNFFNRFPAYNQQQVEQQQFAQQFQQQQFSPQTFQQQQQQQQQLQQSQQFGFTQPQPQFFQQPQPQPPQYFVERVRNPYPNDRSSPQPQTTNNPVYPPFVGNQFYNGPVPQFATTREVSLPHASSIPSVASHPSVPPPLPPTSPPLFSPLLPPLLPSTVSPLLPTTVPPSLPLVPPLSESVGVVPRSALSPNQKLDSCCRKQGVNPVCQNLCDFDKFDDKTLVTAFITGQCPGDQLGKAFDCASTKADHNECCVRGGLQSFLGGKCLPFCNTHKATPSNVLDYLPCLQVFRTIRDCYKDYQSVNPNIFGD